jgi:UDP-glucose 4-epimerase
MTILITGGSGFIGKSLVEGLKGKHKILAPRRKQLDILNANAVEKYILKHKVKVVVHAAVHSALSVTRDIGFRNDFRMFTNLLRCQKHLKKIIYFGSGAEFAKNRHMKKVKEDEFGTHVPEDSYGLSKYVFTELARRDKKIVNLRLFGIYGKHEDYRFKFITNTVVKHLLNMPIKIKQNVVFDYLYIDDLVKITKHFIENESKCSDYNITPTDSVSLKQVVKDVDKAGARKSKLKIVNSGYNFKYTGSNKRLLKEIPGLKFTSLEDGIKDLYNYFKSNLGELDIKAIRKDEFLVKSKTK